MYTYIRQLPKRAFKVIPVFAILLYGMLLSSNAYAATGWIGSGDTGSSSSGGGGGGGGGGGCSGSNANYLLECTGFSWIYYEYIGGAAHEGEEISFRPWGQKEISGACAVQGGGFWHFGRNAKGFSYNGYADYSYLYGSSDDTYVYLGGAGKWGHMETYNFKKYNDYSDWGWGGTPSGVEYYAPTSLEDTLYKKIDGSYVAMYQAKESSSLYGNAWDRFKIAWKGETGSEYTGSAYPDDLYAFCDWGAGEPTEDQWHSISTVFEDGVAKKTSPKDTWNKDDFYESPLTPRQGESINVKFQHNPYLENTLPPVSVETAYKTNIYFEVWNSSTGRWETRNDVSYTDLTVNETPLYSYTLTRNGSNYLASPVVSEGKVTIPTGTITALKVCQKLSYTKNYKFTYEPSGSGTYTASYPDGGAGKEDNSGMCIKYELASPTTDQFYSQSSVEYDGNTSTAVLDGESKYIGNGENGFVELDLNTDEVEVTFRHYIALDDPNTMLSNSKNYEILKYPLEISDITYLGNGSTTYSLVQEDETDYATYSGGRHIDTLSNGLRTLYFTTGNYHSLDWETLDGSHETIDEGGETVVYLKHFATSAHGTPGIDGSSGKVMVNVNLHKVKIKLPNDQDEMTFCEAINYAAKTFAITSGATQGSLEYSSDSKSSSACITFFRSGFEGKIMSTSSVEYESTVTSDFDSRVDYNSGTAVTLEPTDPDPIVTFEQRIWVEMPVTMDKLPDGAHIPYEIFASSTPAGNEPSTGLGDAGMDSESEGGSTADSWTLYSSSDGNYLYYQTVLTDPVMLTIAQGQTVTVCQGTRHQYSAFTIGYGAGGAVASVSLQGPQRESQACIKFTRKRPSTSIPQFNCESTNIYAGRTTSISGVRNLSSSSQHQYTSSSGNPGTYSGWATTGTSPNVESLRVSIYARPGDTIQFTHELCFNAQAVRNSIRWTSGRPNNKFDKPKNWFSVTAKKWQNGTDGANSNYLFGKDAANDAVQITNGNRVHLDINEPYPRAINSDIRAVTRTFAYGFQLFSPDVDAGSMYNVGTAYTSNPFPSENVGYRIPSRDTGSVISQEFKANQVKSWIIYKSHQYGSCNGECPSSGTSDGARNRESGYHSVWTNPNSGPFSSYEAATGTGGTWGFRNNAHYYCYTVCCRWKWCCCSYNCTGSGESRSCTCSHYGYCCCAARRWALSNSATYASRSNDGSGYSGTGTGGGTDRSNGVGDYTPVTDTEGDGLPQFTKTAEVIIPYNYTTSVDISIDHDGGVVYLGESVNINSYKVDLNPRENNKVSTSSYATVSHPATHVQIIEFLVNPNVSLGSQTTGDSSNASDPCSYFISRFGSSSGVRETCAARIYNEDTTINPSGSYTGGTFSGGGIGRIIPDTVEVGTKYCVAIGVYPSGSHLLVSDGYSSRGDTEYSAADPGLRNTYTWNISGASCRTIAKKPNMQVWGGNIYAGGGGVSTSQSTPIVGANWSGSNRTIFGSWDEYGILGGSSSGIASGAALGYSSSFNPIGGASSGSDLNPMSISSISSPTSLLLARLKSRYQIDTDYPRMSGGLCGRIHVTAGSITCGQLENGATYIHSSGNVTIRANSGSAIAIDHNEISETVTSTNSAKSNKGTLILDIAGTLTIGQNICYGSCSVYNSTVDGGKGVYYQTMNKLDVYGRDTYKSIAEIPQVIIFAGNINITDNVTQIDAWLVSEGGKIDTCSSGISDANSCNKTLVINGPVFANSLALNRTAGALQGMRIKHTLTGYDLPFIPMESDSSPDPSVHNIANDGHITPAEIFNLRADTYLWAYSQASRYTEAQTTYTRELAPRY